MQLSPIDQDHLADMRKHSIASWPRVYLAAGFAFVMTFVSSILLGASYFWNAVTGVAILFSLGAILYALLAVGLTTYFETSARRDYSNSLFTRSSFPLEIFIMREALKPRSTGDSK